MRIAWNVRRAGCGPRRRVAAGIASRTISASSRVERTGRAATIAWAMRRAKRSSPYCEMTDGELRLLVAVHDLRRGQRLLGIHAHVERRVEAVREATFGSVELRAAHSEIHQDAHDLFSFTVLLDKSPEPLESPVHHLRPIAEASEPGAGGFHGVGVTVEAEHAHVGARVQQRGRVATATDRAVHDHPFGHRREELHHLPGHHREMRELLRHLLL